MTAKAMNGWGQGQKVLCSQEEHKIQMIAYIYPFIIVCYASGTVAWHRGKSLFP